MAPLEEFQARFDQNEIAFINTQEDTYIWCYPVRLTPLDPAMLWLANPHASVSKKLSLYVHIPFCQFICPMCPFTHEPTRRVDFDRYVVAIKREISFYGHHPLAQTLEVSSIYFGGGTASVMSSGQLGEILEMLSQIFCLAEKCEITVECHPRTLEEKDIETLRAIGFNRISFGIQSFSEENLNALGLHQQPEQSRKIVEKALKVGFDTVAIDLMYHFPGQEKADLSKDLHTAVNLGVQGLSLYALDATAGNLHQVAEMQPNYSIKKEMFMYIHEYLLGAGFVQTAQPDFGLPGHENRYILDLWGAPQAQNIGFGAGAFSESFNGYTWANVHDSRQYMEMVERGEVPILLGQGWNEDDAMTRWFVLGVRCLEVPLVPFEKEFGMPSSLLFKSELEKLIELGWIESFGHTIRVTKEGSFFVDNISKMFFNPSNRGKGQFWGAKLRNAVPKYRVGMETILAHNFREDAKCLMKK